MHDHDQARLARDAVSRLLVGEDAPRAARCPKHAPVIARCFALIREAGVPPDRVLKVIAELERDVADVHDRRTSFVARLAVRARRVQRRRAARLLEALR
jgi:hypothetical protein